MIYDISILACGINVHQRCKDTIPHDCGINQVELAKTLNQMGVLPDTLKPQVYMYIHVPTCIYIYIIV